MNENMPPTGPPAVIGRRRALALLVGGGAAALLAACTRSSDNPTVSAGSDSTGPSTSTADAGGTTSSSAGGGAGAIGRIPEETAGPYPSDGTNGPNALSRAGIVRSDIRSNVGSEQAKADGVGLTVEMTIVDAGTGTALPGATVYLWHCDRIGRYSMYSSGLADDDCLRGVQAADAQGMVRFTSIFPGAYDGRWPHIHFHVFDSQSQATNGRNARVTSQIALPESTCEQVYGAPGYESSARNLDRTSLGSDMVFRDGADLQLATVTGSNSAGYTARLTVGV